MSRWVILALVTGACAQGPPPHDDHPPPPPPGGDDDHNIDPDVSGDFACEGCCSTVDNTMCAKNGTSNYHDMSGLSYSSLSGKFNGFFITNLCSAYPYDTLPNNESHNDDLNVAHFADCRNQTIPSPDLVDDSGKTAQANELRGRIALTIDGVNIYGPFDAGFSEGMVCDSGGYCASGTDVPICEESMEYLCEQSKSTVNYDMLLDTCNGHAIPYHYHADPSCMYSNENASTHSPLIGVSLDGFGIYGLYEGDDSVPTLDACGGHYGTVPTDEEHGVKSTSVYHYHTMDYAPYTMGCYGPVASKEECMALYPDTCYEDPITVETADGDIDYVADCPCWDAPTVVGERDHFTLNNGHYNAAKGRIPLVDADNLKRLSGEKKRVRV